MNMHTREYECAFWYNKKNYQVTQSRKSAITQFMYVSCYSPKVPCASMLNHSQQNDNAKESIINIYLT